MSPQAGFQRTAFASPAWQASTLPSFASAPESTSNDNKTKASSAPQDAILFADTAQE
jgi:hypothetical protein